MPEDSQYSKEHSIAAASGRSTVARMREDDCILSRVFGKILAFRGSGGPFIAALCLVTVVDVTMPEEDSFSWQLDKLPDAGQRGRMGNNRPLFPVSVGLAQTSTLSLFMNHSDVD